MITKQQIQEQISGLQIEQATLTSRHDGIVKAFQQQQAEFQQIVAGNQNRFQQITGAIAELTELMKSLEEPSPPS